MREARAGTAVIGLGNPLMGDDGLGLAVLAALRARWTFSPAVDLVDGGTWGLNLLPVVEQVEKLLFLDAIDIGREPGALVILERDELPRVLATKMSPHQIDLRDVLALAELRGTLPADVAAIGLQPARVEMSTELSDVLASRLDDVLDAALDRLLSWGHSACRTEAAHA
jgi:hydrogenase maturation protease